MPLNRLRTAAALLLVVAGVAATVVGFASSHDAARSAAPTGTWEVATGGFRADARTLADCVAAAQRDQGRSCRAQALGNLAYRRGPEPALDALDRIVARGDDSWRADEPFLERAIGRASHERFDGDAPRAIGAVALTPSRQYDHGVLLATVHAQGSADAARDCVRAPDDLRMVGHRCRFALGMALLTRARREPQIALQRCDRTLAALHAYDCIAGVFKEHNAVVATAPDPTGVSQRSSADALASCNELRDARHQQACFVQAVDRIGPVTGWDWSRVARSCRSIEPTRYVHLCFESFGEWAARRSSGDVALLGAWCATASPFERNCVMAAARTWASGQVGPARHVGGATADAAATTGVARWCATRNGALEVDCYRAVGSTFAGASPGQRARLCAAVAGRFAYACVEAGNRATGRG